MPRFSKMQFLIPEYIKKGLESGHYELAGGIIRNAIDGQPVLWLTHGVEVENQVLSGIRVASATAKLVCLVPVDLGFTVAFASFGFLLGAFTAKKNRIEEIFAKIDRTQFAQLEGGISLAIDAEEIRKPEEATQQIINARQSIQQGLSYFAQELTTRKKDSISSQELIELIGLLAIGHLALVRTYLWTRDYSLAKNRLLRLGLIVAESRILLLEQLKSVVASKAGWRRWWSWSMWAWAITAGVMFVSWPIIAMALMAYMVYKEMSSDEEIEKESQDFEERLHNKITHANKIGQKIENVAKKYEVDFSKIVPSELAALKSTESLVDGYLSEVAYFQQMQICPAIKSSETIPVATAGGNERGA